MLNIKTPFVYSVEMYDSKSKSWKKEIRFYATEQNISDFPDNKIRKNFKLK